MTGIRALDQPSAESLGPSRRHAGPALSGAVPHQGLVQEARGRETLGSSQGHNRTPSLPDGSNTANTDTPCRNLPPGRRAAAGEQRGSPGEDHGGQTAGTPAKVRPLSGRKWHPSCGRWGAVTSVSSGLLRRLGPDLQDSCYPSLQAPCPGLRGGGRPLEVSATILCVALCPPPPPSIPHPWAFFLVCRLAAYSQSRESGSL